MIPDRSAWGAFPYRERAAGKYHAFDAFIQRRNLVERIDFTIDIQFPQPPSYELGDLGTEIQDDYFFCHFPEILLQK